MECKNWHRLTLSRGTNLAAWGWRTCGRREEKNEELARTLDELSCGLEHTNSMLGSNNWSIQPPWDTRSTCLLAVSCLPSRIHLAVPVRLERSMVERRAAPTSVTDRFRHLALVANLAMPIVDALALATHPAMVLRLVRVDSRPSTRTLAKREPMSILIVVARAE
jgi:hypothetical protein